jgi:hypothetical protein
MIERKKRINHQEEERFAMKSKMLDEQIAMKGKMKTYYSADNLKNGCYK